MEKNLNKPPQGVVANKDQRSGWSANEVRMLAGIARQEELNKAAHEIAKGIFHHEDH